MKIPLIIQDTWTDEIYEQLKISEEYLENKEEIMKKYNFRCVLYSTTKKKYFKEFRKDGTPIFTDKLQNANLNSIDFAYINRNKIVDYLSKNRHKRYIESIVFGNKREPEKITLTVSQVIFK